MLIWTLRSLAAFFLGVLMFSAFLVFLLINNFSGKLLDSAFYTETLEQENTYSRVYTQVLLDAELRDTTDGLLGNIEAVRYEDILELLRRILPPEYLRSQVEGNIERSVGYFNGDLDTLEIYLELEPPLARIEPTLLAYLDRQIDTVELLEPDPNKPLLVQLADIQSLLQLALRDLAQGQLPQQIPSIQNIPRVLRGNLFDAFLIKARSDSTLDLRVRRGLAEAAPDLRRDFLSGDTHRFLKQTLRAAGKPLMQDAIAEIELNLDSQGRLDLIALLARENPETTEALLRQDIARGRDQLQRANSQGRRFSLGVVIVAAIALGLIYLPHWSETLRWPGVALLSIGLVYLGLGRILENTLPSQISRLVDQQLAQFSQMPQSAEFLIQDLTGRFSQRLVEGIADPAQWLVLIGAALLAGSFLVAWGGSQGWGIPSFRRRQPEAPRTYTV